MLFKFNRKPQLFARVGAVQGLSVKLVLGCSDKLSKFYYSHTSSFFSFFFYGALKAACVSTLEYTHPKQQTYQGEIAKWNTCTDAHKTPVI